VVVAPPSPSAEAAYSPAPTLEFQVIEHGPDQPWVLQIDNRGDAPVQLVADARLLWFEVQTSASKVPVTCRLPKPLWPEFAVREARLTLPPGHGFRRAFDPRFFCFAPVAQTLLVPNARVVPHFGWPQPTRTVWKQGKRIEELLLPEEPPFVASTLLSVPGAASAANDASTSEPTRGVKHLLAPSLLLSSAYSVWSEPPSATDEQTLVLDAQDGADADEERDVTIATALTNRSKRAQRIYLRAELVRYHASGPEGSFECRSAPISGPSDASSFTTLQPGKTLRLVERLIEVCPRGNFARPGLYEVKASYQTHWSGQQLGIDAFTGELVSERSVFVRIRTGEKPFFIERSEGQASEAVEVAGVDGPPVPRTFAPGQNTGDDASGEPGADDAAPEDGHEQAPAEDAPPMPDDAVE
jgi:hypothetical protein